MTEAEKTLTPEEMKANAEALRAHAAELLKEAQKAEWELAEAKREEERKARAEVRRQQDMAKVAAQNAIRRQMVITVTDALMRVEGGNALLVNYPAFDNIPAFNVNIAYPAPEGRGSFIAHLELGLMDPVITLQSGDWKTVGRYRPHKDGSYGWDKMRDSIKDLVLGRLAKDSREKTHASNETAWLEKYGRIIEDAGWTSVSRNRSWRQSHAPRGYTPEFHPANVEAKKGDVRIRLEPSKQFAAAWVDVRFEADEQTVKSLAQGDALFIGRNG